MRTLTIKGMEVGAGRPKIIVSIMGRRYDELAEQLRRGLEAGADCIEYRADFASDVRDCASLAKMARSLAQGFPKVPLLFTFRSEGQGGKAALAADEYRALCEAVIADASVDAIDIESWIGDDPVRELCRKARAAGIAAVVSFHDFECTPSVDDMADMLAHFDELGADIPKIAVMAHTPADALRLLEATERVRAAGSTGPLLTMAMGAAGSITRLVGEAFGSALTFCAVGNASAPGQVNASQARDIMAALHEVLGS